MILYGIWGTCLKVIFQCQILSWYVKEISTIWGMRQDDWISPGWRISHLQYFDAVKRRYRSAEIEILIVIKSTRFLRTLNNFYRSLFTQKCTYFVKEFTLDSTCISVAFYMTCGRWQSSFLVCVLSLGGFKGRVWAQLYSWTDWACRRVPSSKGRKWYFSAFLPRDFLPYFVTFGKICAHFAHF